MTKQEIIERIIREVGEYNENTGVIVDFMEKQLLIIEDNMSKAEEKDKEAWTKTHANAVLAIEQKKSSVVENTSFIIKFREVMTVV